MITLKKINITVEGTDLQVSEDLSSIEQNEERIGCLSYACKDRSRMLINGIEFFKLPEGGDLANQFIQKGWKEKGWSGFIKKLSEEQNQEIETEWIRVSSEFDRMMLAGEIKMSLRMPIEQTNVFFDVANCINSTLNPSALWQYVWDLTYYWQEKYNLNAWYKLPEEIKTELVEKREVEITAWAIDAIKKQQEEEKQEEIRFKQIIEGEKAKIEQAKEEELMIYGTEILSCNTNLLLHSLAIHCTEENIELYTTAYAKEIPDANTSYSIKEELKKQGFRFNGENKHWDLTYNEENLNKAVEILKKYDTKADPAELGLQRCWECGCYRKNLDSSGYCGC